MKILRLFEQYKKRKNNIIFIPPCYYIKNNLDSNSVIIDIGTGFDADFSVALIKKYDSKSFGFDPTKKHHESLKKIEKEYYNNFKINNYALASKSGQLLFNESKENVSGSFLEDHINVKRDTTNKYLVEAKTLKDILKIVNYSKINLIKIDIEGSEYDVFKTMPDLDYDNISQFIVEFHHHCIDSYSINNTNKIIKNFKKTGYKVFTEDNINYLFFKK